MQIKNILRDLIKKCGQKNIVLDNNIECIEVNPNDIYYFNLSSNPIKIITIENKLYYFRECRAHKDYKDYVRETLDRFYDIALKPAINDNFEQEVPIKQTFSSCFVSSFKKYIENSVEEYGFIERSKFLSGMLETTHFSIWDGNYEISEESLNKIGLVDYPKELRPILPLFLLYMRSGTKGWKGKKGTLECYNACRMIASAIVAGKVGVKEIYTSAKLIKLKHGVAEEYGVLSNKAPGIRAMDTDAIPTPSLQRQLATLNLVDVLCYQPDHWINNYNIILDNQNRAVDVCAFDNDNGKTFFPSCGIGLSCYHGGTPFINSQGLISVPHIDENVARNVLELTYSDLKTELSPYLNGLQLFCLWVRLKKIKEAIIKTSSVRKDFLLSYNEFSEKTLTEELSGKYGNTYLYLYANRSEQ